MALSHTKLIMDERNKTLELLQIAINDKNVKESSELFKLISDSLKTMKAGKEYTLICIKLSNSISKYLLGHQFRLPDSVNNLVKQIEPIAQKYRGRASISMWANKLF